MKPEAQEEHERSSRGDGLFWLGCLGVVLTLYVLSSGPAVMMLEKANLFRWRAADFIYHPVFWAYQQTFLHKPLGMYWHLWSPSHFDSKGNIIPAI